MHKSTTDVVPEAVGDHASAKVPNNFVLHAETYFDPRSHYLDPLANRCVDLTQEGLCLLAI